MLQEKFTNTQKLIFKIQKIQSFIAIKGSFYTGIQTKTLYGKMENDRNNVM